MKANNRVVAEALRDAAALFAHQDAGQFRVSAYRNAAKTIEELPDDVADVAARGADALDALPHIGKSIASAIVQLTTTGRWPQLERMRGRLDPEVSFQNIPGIGPIFARLIHEHLHVDTLEALEAAAHDGRLDTVPGIGERRGKVIRQSLASILARKGPLVSGAQKIPPPPIEMILDVDREYRERAKAGDLKLIAPKRFNPKGEAWLPILHTERGPWHFTVLFSNTARAHELGKTADWVIVFYSSNHQIEDQNTVVSETKGPLKGQRVVRGREPECLVRLHQNKTDTGNSRRLIL
ncbi:MAG: helix-hairpin-helix domain-containing protein [Aestuariivirga sp.]|nr:helix-hairpin-helix domain-containing protein [Aestuariivirga sp.]